MKTALLLIDLQIDFLERENLTPCKEDIIQETGILLDYFRETNQPVIHIQTLIKSDGSNRMPHWVSTENWSCIEGSTGSLPPIELIPKNSEPIVGKTFFSAFESNKLHSLLKSLGIDTVIISGLYTHACIRSTALDAYQHHYTVWIANKAIGTTEPLYAELTLNYLSKRGICLKDTNDIIANVTCLANNISNKNFLTHTNPINNHELISEIAIASKDDVFNAAKLARKTLQPWRKKDIKSRTDILNKVIEIICNRKIELVNLVVKEIGKPAQDCLEEFDRAVSQARHTVSQFGNQSNIHEIIDDDIHVHYKPIGVIGLITPWNNPLAIPLSKIISALIFGNTVVWKPAHQTTITSQLIINILAEADVPNGCVNILFGDATTAQWITTHPIVDAITVTGSISTGKQLASLCAMNMKPLQAELGGNNAAIVMADCNLEKYINSMVMSAFSFSGQRCTAIRRFIVEESIKNKFISLFIQAVSKLTTGYPDKKETQIGPLISRKHQQAVLTSIEQAISDGASLLHGGNVPDGLTLGNWIEPTVLLVDNQDLRIVQEETFGPVVVIQGFIDFDEAINKCNGVKQGLVANLYSADLIIKEKFLSEVETGIARINPDSFTIHPEAPFLGWKSSGIGSAEHGKWERDFFTRPQAQYN